MDAIVCEPIRKRYGIKSKGVITLEAKTVDRCVVGATGLCFETIIDGKCHDCQMPVGAYHADTCWFSEFMGARTEVHKNEEA